MTWIKAIGKGYRNPDWTALKVDGGASQRPILNAVSGGYSRLQGGPSMIRETTALGAAYLAGLAVGVWKDRKELCRLWHCDTTFYPQMEEERHQRLLHGWHKAVGRSKGWAESDGE